MGCATKEAMKLYRETYVAVFRLNFDHNDSDKQATIAVENFEKTFEDCYEEDANEED